jgi:hypothetical protein
MAEVLHKFVETLHHRTANYSPLIHVIYSFVINLAKQNKNNLISSTRMR